MKSLAVGVVAATALLAQQSSTYTYDINGNRTPAARAVSGPNGRVQTTVDLNGKEVPFEAVTEKVISESGSTRVVERTRKRSEGVGGVVVERIEEQRDPLGNVQTSTTVFEDNGNGGRRVVEKRNEATRKIDQFNASNEIVVERPGPTGTFEVIEKTLGSTVSTADGSSTSNSVTSRRDLNGRFGEVARSTAERKVNNGRMEESVAEYQNASTGQMQLVRQVVTSTTTNPDGSSQQVIDFYAPTAPGKSGTGPQLTKRQIVDRQATANGAAEVISVQLANSSDPGKLGSIRKVEERVCTGECGQRKNP